MGQIFLYPGTKRGLRNSGSPYSQEVYELAISSFGYKSLGTVDGVSSFPKFQRLKYPKSSNPTVSAKQNSMLLGMLFFLYGICGIRTTTRIACMHKLWPSHSLRLWCFAYREGIAVKRNRPVDDRAGDGRSEPERGSRENSADGVSVNPTVYASNNGWVIAHNGCAVSANQASLIVNTPGPSVAIELFISTSQTSIKKE